MLRYMSISVLVCAIGFGPATSTIARVKRVDVDDDGRTTPTIEVFQTEDLSGKLHYTKLKGSNFPDPNVVNLRVEVAAQCRWGYELSLTQVVNENRGHQNPFAGQLEPVPGVEPDISDPTISQNVPFTPGNRTLGARIVDFHVPLDYFAPLIAYGNERVTARAGSIVEENNIRASDWTAYLDQPVALEVRCARAVGYTGLEKWWAADTFLKPVRIVYRGASAEFDLANPAPGDGAVWDPLLPPQFEDLVNVDANLLILTDEADECVLHLSGTFTTNGETNVFYYLVDDRGRLSPLYKVAVDQTFTAFVHHPVDLSEREPEGPFPATDRGFSVIPTDRVQGFYVIEVVSPHRTTSNIASYDIAPCATRPDTIGTIVSD